MSEFIENYRWLIISIIIWSVPWKAVALWKSARRGQKIWFVLLLILNTAALLEIIYIFLVSRKYRNDLNNFRSFAQNDYDSSQYLSKSHTNSRRAGSIDGLARS